MLSKSVVKDIQSLQHKKFRDAAGLFIAEGPKVVQELLDGGNFKSEKIYHTSAWKNTLEKTGLTLDEISEADLEKISSRPTPNQVLGLFHKKPVIPVNAKVGRLTLLLDVIQDPGNLGTIIRIADWYGIENIVCTLNTADCYNPKVVQSTMASLGRVNILYTDVFSWLRENNNVEVYAAALQGTPLQKTGPVTSGILIIGNEARGIDEKLLQLADHLVTIPRLGKAESLNAAVAAGIILHSFLFSGTV